MRPARVRRSGQQGQARTTDSSRDRIAGESMTDLLASRSFGLDDQESFARLSSDFNPIHLDQQFARRTQAGAPIVHGIHTLLWAANAVLQASPISVVANVSARFPQPLYLDELASVRLKSRTDRQIDVEVIAADTIVALIN